MGATVTKFGANMISFGWFNESLLSRVLFNMIFKTGFRDIRKEVEKAKHPGVRVLGGIVDNESDLNYFLNAGVDGVMIEELEVIKNNP